MGWGFVEVSARCNLIPLTGTVTSNLPNSFSSSTMQPYTPHGDSNEMGCGKTLTAIGCNLIPLTGTVTRRRKSWWKPPPGCNLIPLTGTVTTASLMAWATHKDATLYPSRGQ